MKVRMVADGSPSASVVRQPVSRSATGFRYIILPAMSVVMTASPIDSRVITACSFSRNRFSWARRHSVRSRMVTSTRGSDPDRAGSG